MWSDLEKYVEHDYSFWIRWLANFPGSLKQVLYPSWAEVSLRPEASWIGDVVIFPAWSLVTCPGPIGVNGVSSYPTTNLWPTWAGADWVSPPDTSYLSQLLMTVVVVGRWQSSLNMVGLQMMIIQVDERFRWPNHEKNDSSESQLSSSTCIIIGKVEQVSVVLPLWQLSNMRCIWMCHFIVI